MTNSFLMARVDLAIKRTHKNETKVCIMDRIKNFYRVVGIILFRAITSGHLISHHIMPNFYQNGTLFVVIFAPFLLTCITIDLTTRHFFLKKKVFLLNIEPKLVRQNFVFDLLP